MGEDGGARRGKDRASWRIEAMHRPILPLVVAPRQADAGDARGAGLVAGVLWCKISPIMPVPFRPLPACLLFAGALLALDASAAEPAPEYVRPAFLSRTALLADLETGDFQALEQRLGAAQSAYEEARTRSTEETILHALATFAMVTPQRIDRLAAWSERFPDSAFAPAAEGIARGEQARRDLGSPVTAPRGAAETNARIAAFARAERLLAGAVERRPMLSAAAAALVQLMMQSGRLAEAEDTFRAHRRADAKGYGLRAAHLAFLLPRWGGALASVNAAAYSPQPFFALNPGMKALSGFLPWARGEGLLDVGRPEQALAEFDRALGRGMDRRFLASRAAALQALGRHEEALAAFGEALDAWPEEPAVMAARARVLAALARTEDAENSLDVLQGLDPASPDLVVARRAVEIAARGLDCTRLVAAATTYQADDAAAGEAESGTVTPADIGHLADLRTYMLCEGAFAHADVQRAFWKARSTR